MKATKGFASAGCRRRNVISLLLASCGALSAQPAFAQPEAPRGTSQEQVEPEILVTGSRIARRDYTADSPIVTIGEEDLKAAGTPGVESYLNQLPSVAPADATFTPALGNGSTTINLRGLGPQRNLVLLDGRRLQPSNSNGTVDINTIPKALIATVETITGGASATYGSDAISGVINFRLKPSFQGVQLDAQYGISDRGDAQTYEISGTIGGNFADGRGNAVLSIGYNHRDKLLTFDRPFFRAPGGNTGAFLQGSVNPNAANAPSQAAVNALFASYGFAPGTVPNTTGFGINDDRTLFAVTPAVGYRGSSDVVAIVNNAYVLQQNQTELLSNNLVGGLDKYNVFGRARYELTDWLSAYAQVNFTEFTAHKFSQATIAFSGTQFVVPVTNPFIPASLATLLATRPNPGATFTMNKVMGELGQKTEREENTIYQVLAGLRAKLPFGDWTADLFASHGRTNYTQVFDQGWASLAKVQQLLNAANGGTSLCAGGYNPFGTSTLSTACRTFVQVSPVSHTTYDQDIVEIDLQGGLLELPGGQLRGAVGASHRKEAFNFRPDPAITSGDIVGVTSQLPLAGGVEVDELYGELLVPILRDIPGIKSLELGLGYRYSSYNTIGGTSAYRATGNWQIFGGLAVRGGYQRAVRAPNFQELFSPAVVGFATLPSGRDPCSSNSPERTGSNAGAVRSLCLAQGVPAAAIDSYRYPAAAFQVISQGNTALKEETADTYSIGVTWQSRGAGLLKGLRASADYYNIRIADAISPVAGAISVSKCFNQDGSNPSYSNSYLFCGNIFRDPTTGFISARQPYLNVGSFKVSGVDFSLDWDIGLSDIGTGLPGNLILGFLGSYLDSYRVVALPGAAPQQFADTIGSSFGTLPRFKSTTELTYALDGFALGLRWRYIEGVDHFTRVTSPTSIQPGSRATSYFDLNASFRVAQGLTLRAGVNNLFDQEPRLVGGVIGSTDTSTYDVVGRRVFVSATAKF